MAYSGTADTYPAALRTHPRLALIAWIGGAAFVALLQAAASTISWKIGLAAVIALIFSMVLIARPVLLLPVAGITVLLEAVTLSGMPVTRLLAPGAAMVVIAEFIRGGGRVRPGPPLVVGDALHLLGDPERALVGRARTGRASCSSRSRSR